MTPARHSLPVKRAAQQDESGMGFLLRSATANGLSLHGLRDLAGLSSVRNIWRSDSTAFARVLGMPESELQPLLTDKGTYLGESAYHIGGQTFFRSELLRQLDPQICVACIHRTGYCKTMWDCKLYTVCHLHKKPMVSACNTCGKELRWYRPAVDVCQCGAYFKPMGDLTFEPDCLEVAVATWIASYFDPEASVNWVGQSVPRWLPELSLDGLCTLVQAFGLQATTHQKILNSRRGRKTVEYWQAVCARAGQRLSEYTNSASPDALVSYVWEGGLESMALAAVSHADRQVAVRLLRDIFLTDTGARFGSQRAALCQMHLFGD